MHDHFHESKWFGASPLNVARGTEIPSRYVAQVPRRPDVAGTSPATDPSRACRCQNTGMIRHVAVTGSGRERRTERKGGETACRVNVEACGI